MLESKLTIEISGQSEAAWPGVEMFGESSEGTLVGEVRSDLWKAPEETDRRGQVFPARISRWVKTRCGEEQRCLSAAQQGDCVTAHSAWVLRLPNPGTRSSNFLGLCWFHLSL